MARSDLNLLGYIQTDGVESEKGTLRELETKMTKKADCSLLKKPPTFKPTSSFSAPTDTDDYIRRSLEAFQRQ
jgi:hypothetical protein